MWAFSSRADWGLLISGGFSCCGTQALGRWMSVFAACGFGSCDSGLPGMGSVTVVHGYCSTACGFPRPGIEPVVLALAGGFLSIMPSRKSSFQKFCLDFSFLPYVWRSARSTSIGNHFAANSHGSVAREMSRQEGRAQIEPLSWSQRRRRLLASLGEPFLDPPNLLCLSQEPVGNLQVPTSAVGLLGTLLIQSQNPRGAPPSSKPAVASANRRPAL